MKKFILYKIIPLLIISVFVCIMQSGMALKQPLSKKDDVIFYMDAVEEHIISEQWEIALELLIEMEKAHEIVVKRIQYSVERDELDSLTTSMKKAGGYIRAQEKGGALAELSEVRYLWNGLGE